MDQLTSRLVFSAYERYRFTVVINKPIYYYTLSSKIFPNGFCITMSLDLFHAFMKHYEISAVTRGAR